MYCLVFIRPGTFRKRRAEGSSAACANDFLLANSTWCARWERRGPELRWCAYEKGSVHRRSEFIRTGDRPIVGKSISMVTKTGPSRIAHEFGHPHQQACGLDWARPGMEGHRPMAGYYLESFLKLNGYDAHCVFDWEDDEHMLEAMKSDPWRWHSRLRMSRTMRCSPLCEHASEESSAQCRSSSVGPTSRAATASNAPRRCP